MEKLKSDKTEIWHKDIKKLKHSQRKAHNNSANERADTNEY